MNGIDYIRDCYGVPAKIGGRVRVEFKDHGREGTIVGTDTAYLRIKLDGEKHAYNYHPTYKLTYLDQ